MDKKRGIYAGSFDPVTNGHLWMIRQGAVLFDEFIIAVGDNPEKQYSFTHEERLMLIREIVKPIPNARVVDFRNRFLVEYAAEVKADYILRGIRNVPDYEFERAMRHINADLRPNISTIFLMPPREYAEISSSFVKGLIGPEGWQEVVSRYIPEAVFRVICEKRNEPVTVTYPQGG